MQSVCATHTCLFYFAFGHQTHAHTQNPTGKTSFIQRYTNGFFCPNYKLTIGVDFTEKVLPPKEQKVAHPNPETGDPEEVVTGTRPALKLQLWDIAGHERFGNMTHVYYKDATAAVVVFDVLRPGTLDAAQKWKEDVDSKVALPNGDRIPCLLLANKVDLAMASPDDTELSNAPAGINPAAISRFAEENRFIGWFPVSVMSNLNVDASMEKLADAIAEVTKDLTPQAPAPDIIIPDQHVSDTQQQRQSCCSN